MKFKIGDKVKIISKSWGCKLEKSYVYKNNEKIGIWYVIDILGFNEEQIYSVAEQSCSAGDYFLESDLEYLDGILKFEDDDFEI